VSPSDPDTPRENKFRDQAAKAFENTKWFFSDPNRALAVLTASLVLIGIGALCIQRDTEERQLRAYVFIDPVGMTYFDTKIPPKFTLDVHDAGQTPALNVAMFTKIDVLPYPLPKDFAFKEPKDADFVGRFLVNPGIPTKDWPVLDAPLAADQLAAIGKQAVVDSAC
jgi:hypothetical protein